MKPLLTTAFDVETNAKDPRCDPDFRVLGVSFASDNGETDYLGICHRTTNADAMAVSLQRLRSQVGRTARFVFHNAKFDLTCFDRLGMDLWQKQWYDTLLMQHMVDENIMNKGLDYLGQHYFKEGKEVSEEFDRFIKTFGWEFIPEWMIRDYAIQDARLTLRLFFRLLPEFERQGYLNDR